eukprot:2726034-Heterocapsa_arctica.AAC.1
MVGHSRAVIEIDQYKIWGDSMHKMTTNLRAGNEYSMQSRKESIWAVQEMRAGHILCQKPCTLQEHHDNKWKYRKKGKQNHIDNDGEHKGPQAENIDFKGGNPVMDTIALGNGGKMRHLDMPTGGNVNPTS